MLVVARELLCLGLYDLLVVAREFLNPRLSRSGLYRMLQRLAVSTLRELVLQDTGDEKPRYKLSKDYELSYVHIDINELSRMPGYINQS